jgi:hypothetical protein
MSELHNEVELSFAYKDSNTRLDEIFVFASTKGRTHRHFQMEPENEAEWVLWLQHPGLFNHTHL